MKPLTFILLISITCLPAQEMDRLFWNGSDWRRLEKFADYDPELTYMMKIAYINGVLDSRLFYYLKAWTMEQGLPIACMPKQLIILPPEN